MNWKPLVFVGAAVLVASPMSVDAQTVLSDFSDLAGQTPTFLDSWTDSGNAQFVQDAGYVTITPVSAGNPQSDGSFQVSVSLDLTGFTSLGVTAREGAANSTGVFSVVFFNNDGFGGIGAERGYTFAAGGFAAGSFLSQSVALESYTFSDSTFDPSAIAYWSIEGDYGEVPPQDFRFEFDNVQLTPVPEPATWASLALGAGAFFLRRRRARS